MMNYKKLIPILSKPWLKLTAGFILPFLAILVLFALWPSQPEQTQQPTETKQAVAPAKQETAAHAEKLWETAVKYNKPSSIPYLSYKKTADTCREILRRYPDSRQAEKAQKLLWKLPQYGEKEPAQPTVAIVKRQAQTDFECRMQARQRHHDRADELAKDIKEFQVIAPDEKQVRRLSDRQRADLDRQMKFLPEKYQKAFREGKYYQYPGQRQETRIFVETAA